MYQELIRSGISKSSGYGVTKREGLDILGCTRYVAQVRSDSTGMSFKKWFKSEVILPGCGSRSNVAPSGVTPDIDANPGIKSKSK